MTMKFVENESGTVKEKNYLDPNNKLYTCY